ncbi:hypothetical protein AB1Y20_009465 [Prymnesium parvum]|uniref:Secreted protein n=1 Tax=Prymnesium parvum TaxID=97485 RepID=A0AB34K5S2_PRYPA
MLAVLLLLLLLEDARSSQCPILMCTLHCAPPQCGEGCCAYLKSRGRRKFTLKVDKMLEDPSAFRKEMGELRKQLYGDGSTQSNATRPITPDLFKHIALKREAKTKAKTKAKKKAYAKAIAKVKKSKAKAKAKAKTKDDASQRVQRGNGTHGMPRPTKLLQL